MTPRKYIVHFGFNNDPESNLIRRYAERQGCEYRWEGLKNDLFRSASVIKYASMAVIWNGLQHGTPLATRMCRRRGIPVCYVEQGLLPQANTFLIDPGGFCGDSILARDVSWVTESDMQRLHQVRAELQALYPLNRGEHVLAVLQIENDSQTLYFSPYRKMEEFVADVEAMYPTEKIIARPHPKSTAKRTFVRAKVEGGGDFLEAASKAGVVVGITSTCLYEAAILGVPVVAIGDHPLRLQPRHLHERVLAGALALRVDRATGDLGAILDRFGIRPL
jgi:capsule polysaccharide export protein KpsC/LpsZ